MGVVAAFVAVVVAQQTPERGIPDLLLRRRGQYTLWLVLQPFYLHSPPGREEGHGFGKEMQLPRRGSVPPGGSHSPGSLWGHSDCVRTRTGVGSSRRTSGWGRYRGWCRKRCACRGTREMWRVEG